MDGAGAVQRGLTPNESIGYLCARDGYLRGLIPLHCPVDQL